MDIVNFSKQLDTLVDKYDLGEISASYKNQYAISKTSELEDALNQIQNEARVLKIGIVGRVKAGKSSLLNSLIFDGKSILPKAATPMTAALTIMEYSENVKAKVDFFTQEDIDDIKKDYDIFTKELKVKELEEFNKLVEIKKSRNKPYDEAELKEKAKKKAFKDLQSNEKLSASYEQYSKISSSNLDLKELEQYKTIQASTSQELNEKLKEFVGADGKYMPYTKSVTLQLNEPNLKDVQIIDTPGVNDPVVSREERTKELLKYCDVVLILSPSGQFLSSEDTDLFDRISQKEGINEIYLIASKVDDQLFGNEKDDNGGVLPKVLDSVTNNLTSQMQNVFQSNEYLKSNVTFQNLLSNKVIHSSGIAYSILKKLQTDESFDSNEEHTLNMLKTYYREYFSDDISIEENLKLLANIDTIKNIIDNVKVKKDEILKAKKENFVATRLKNLQDYHQELIKYIENKIDTINNSDINSTKKKLQEFKEIKEKATIAVEDTYKDILDVLQTDLKSSMLDKLNSYFKQSKRDIQESEGEDSEQYQEYVGRGGFLWLQKKYETRTRRFTTVKAGFVRNSLEELTDEIENVIDIDAKQYIQKWRKDLVKVITRTLRDSVGDDKLDASLINQTIRKVISSVTMPEISYTGSFPKELKQAGTLKGSSAESFLNAAQDYVSDLHVRVKKDITSYLNSLVNTMSSIDLAQNIFKTYIKEMEELQHEIENKEIALEKYKRILDEFKSLKG